MFSPVGLSRTCHSSMTVSVRGSSNENVIGVTFMDSCECVLFGPPTGVEMHTEHVQVCMQHSHGLTLTFAISSICFVVVVSQP